MTAKPQRIQLSRAKGFNLQAASRMLNGLDAVNCARPGRWGNPYFPGCGLGFGNFDDAMRPAHWPLETPADSVRHFREFARLMEKDEPARFTEHVNPLRGKNLACYCKPGDPCHADVLLEIANR